MCPNADIQRFTMHDLSLNGSWVTLHVCWCPSAFLEILGGIRDARRDYTKVLHADAVFCAVDLQRKTEGFCLSRLGHIHALIDRLGDDPGLWPWPRHVC